MTFVNYWNGLEKIKDSIFLRVARKTAERLLDGDKILKLFSLEKFDLLQVSLPAKFWI